MIIEEPYGDDLVRHYSDRGMMMLQVETGLKYGDAIDVTPCPYTYVETDEPMDGDGDEEASPEELLEILLGGM